MTDDGSAAVADRIRAVFAAAGARGFVHVREIGGSSAVDVDADEPVVVASVIKIAVAVAFARAVSAGDVDASQRVAVPARYRVGGAGTAGCLDPVEMSLRDLALFMMSVSDNAATDVVYQRVGQQAIDAVLRDLGLRRTYARGDMESVGRSIVAELGLDGADDLDAKMMRAGDAVWELSCLDPQRASASTPREIGLLLEAIWTDRAGPPDACERVRLLMSHQVMSHRLASGFPADDIGVASKTGTLPAVRNEAGVVTYPDGRRYVAAVFTRASTLTDRQPAIDAAIGRAASLAVEQLRRTTPR